MLVNIRISPAQRSLSEGQGLELRDVVATSEKSRCLLILLHLIPSAGVQSPDTRRGYRPTHDSTMATTQTTSDVRQPTTAPSERVRPVRGQKTVVGVCIGEQTSS